MSRIDVVIKFRITFMVISLLLLFFSNIVNGEPLLRTCEPIRVELCSGLGYNMTSMPNLGGNDLQQEADYTLKSFSPLIQYGCSSQLKLFLCSVYVPMCTEKVTNPIGPCRGLCESVRSRCYPVLKGFGFPWPDALNCSRFPLENNHEHMCMEGPKDKGIDITQPVVTKKFDCNGKSDGNCASLCDTTNLFDEAEKNFSEVWVTVWALICFITSLGSALTLSIGGGRVRARPLISLAVCYCMVSAGWALRMFSGRMPSPSSSAFSSTCLNNLNNEIPEDGLSNVNCAFVFLLIYYFGMAANAWWVCLCAWWLARVGLNWPPEKLRSLGTILHVLAWGLPAGQTVAALVRRDVDSDELTGTCYIGNHNITTLLALVLTPLFIYSLIGIIILIFGCYCVIKKPRQSASIPLTSITPRKESDFLGAICTLYTIPTLCVVVSIYYEYNNRDIWLKGEKKPSLWVFLLKHLMSLFIGVSTIFWIWSIKTITAWKCLLRRLGPRKQLPIKVQNIPPVLRYIPSVQPPPPPPPQSSSSSIVHHTNIISSNLSTTSRHSNRSHPHRKPRLHHNIRNGGETVI